MSDAHYTYHVPPEDRTRETALLLWRKFAKAVEEHGDDCIVLVPSWVIRCVDKELENLQWEAVLENIDGLFQGGQ